jgi:hypothetical protein
VTRFYVLGGVVAFTAGVLAGPYLWTRIALLLGAMGAATLAYLAKEIALGEVEL